MTAPPQRRDKTMTPEEVVGRLSSGMTIGIGGWGSRRKPMALVRALLRSSVTDLTVISYGGPDVGLLAAAGRIRRLVTAFVTLDSIPLEPHYRAARQRGVFALTEIDEAMFMWGLHAAANRLPFLPVRAGLGSDVMRVNPGLRTVTSPYEDGEEFVAAPALRMDAALVHLNRADRLGNGQYLGPDPYFDDLFCEAADAAYVSCERLVETRELTEGGRPLSALLVQRHAVTGVVETPGGAHFTSCVPDHPRDEPFQKAYATAAADPAAWAAFAARFLPPDGDEKSYREAVRVWHEEQK
ncbi:acyl CoA--acetate/3-ketoacid CoA transferase subunit alpha [Streptomyces sp. ATCC51928]|uniref:CoA transferase subunit A n=1 Tax=Streptomyces caviscabies TaxID=90079 RepID=A0ABW2MB27_9ACTN|nr:MULTISPECIES: CoA-transferase [unclassified Streptomyces]MDX3501554.1 acyl CoA--acetate/3-ketoacid CoA transferase subunit alpha [Streptomyces sp. ATCC51928]MDX5521328.1 acyl CoA--acetate/3-ketoacid CoA transferase subunit alpha [Streptomyces sp. DE06-01C]